MKVDIKEERRFVKAVIELEREKELDCLNYLLFVDANPYASDIRKRELELHGLDGDDIRGFQRELRSMLREGNC